MKIKINPKADVMGISKISLKGKNTRITLPIAIKKVLKLEEISKEKKEIYARFRVYNGKLTINFIDENLDEIFEN